MCVSVNEKWSHFCLCLNFGNSKVLIGICKIMSKNLYEHYKYRVEIVRQKRHHNIKMFSQFSNPFAKEKGANLFNNNKNDIQKQEIIKPIFSAPLKPASVSPPFQVNTGANNNPNISNNQNQEVTALKQEIKDIKAQLQAKQKRIVSLENMVNTIMPTLQLCLKQLNSIQPQPLKQQPSRPLNRTSIFDGFPSFDWKTQTSSNNQPRGLFCFDPPKTCLNKETLKMLEEQKMLTLRDNGYKVHLTNSKHSSNGLFCRVEIINTHGQLEFVEPLDVQPLLNKDISTWLTIDARNMKAHCQALQNRGCKAVYYNFAGYADADPYQKQVIVDELNSARSKFMKLDFNFTTGRLQVLSKGL